MNRVRIPERGDNGRLLLKRIHVDQHVIRANLKNGTQLPAVTVQARGGPYKAQSVEIMGRSMVVTGEKPLSCGARIWIETTAPVYIGYELGLTTHSAPDDDPLL